MRIAYCGPISLHLLGTLGLDETALPAGYRYAFGAYLVREYVTRGHEVSVITTAPRIAKPLQCRASNLSVYVIPQRRYFRFCLDGYRKERTGLKAAISEASPDVVHAQWTYEFAHAAIDSGFPTLVTARDSPRQILRHMPSAYRLFRAAYGRYVISRCRNLSTLSPYMRDELTSTYKLTDPPIVIPNGIAPAMLYDRQPREPGVFFTFTCVAGWDQRKNPKPLLRAFAELRQTEPDVRLLLIGRGFEPNGLAARWLQRHGGASRVEFRGSLPHDAVLQILRAETDAFVHPTREESFGMAIVEAMAVKLPVIAGNRSGAVPWLLDFGAAGLLCDVNSPVALLKAMKCLLYDAERAKQCAIAAFERARTVFTIDAASSGYLTELARIAHMPGGCVATPA